MSMVLRQCCGLVNGIQLRKARVVPCLPGWACYGTQLVLRVLPWCTTTQAACRRVGGKQIAPVPIDLLLLLNRKPVPRCPLDAVSAREVRVEIWVARDRVLNMMRCLACRAVNVDHVTFSTVFFCLVSQWMLGRP